MKKIFLLIVLALLGVMNSTLFANTSICKKDLEIIPILQGGRVKPLYVHASETMKNLTGKAKVQDLSAVEAFCALSLNGMGIPSTLKLEARIDHVDLMKFLGLAKDQHSISFEELLVREEAIRTEGQSIKDNPSYATAIGKLYDSIYVYKEIKSGQNWLLANVVNNQIVWQPLTVYLSEDKVVAQKAITPENPFLPVLLKSKVDYDRAAGNNKYELELYYAKMGLANWALLFCILALASMVLMKNFNVAIGLASLSAVAQLIHIALRVIISGRAPITNMYETVLFSGFGALIFGLIFGHLKKEKLFVYVGLAYNVCTLMMLTFANGMLSATISPLVPVLRDNFWLSTHVTMIILSYGALALSWILANTALFKRRWGNLTSKDETTYADIIYTTLKWGTVLLAGGIILGGVWADYSWGRFWGWDPKETWSLIVLCTYMAILHGKHTTWIKTGRFITITAGAFMTVMMAWFGVNYILASGLHSYGFSEGGAIFLGVFFLTQTAILVVTSVGKNNKMLKSA